jgi:hypothetical protein
MTVTRAAVALALTALFLAPAVQQAQEKPAPTSGSPAMPPMPKPGPEHAVFTEEAGTWDATVEMLMDPSAPPMTSKGVETNTVGCGGLCLITDFKGEMMPGQTFHGHGTAVYDPAKKKYVGSWTDSMSQGLAISEATWDPATRTMTGWMEGPDMSGNVTKMKSVVVHKDANTRVFTMYMAGPDGKETVGMRITYTRKK